MAWKQLIQPNTAITGSVGWCLMYARQVFGRPVVEPSAWNAWERAQLKHWDNNLPDGMTVPVWFDYWKDNVRYGHVGVRTPDGRVWSSPYLLNTSRAIFKSIEECERVLGAKYVGWSEDISGAKVIGWEEEEVKIGNGDNWRFRMNRLHHQLVGNWDMSDQVFKSIIGKEAWQVIEDWSDHNNADKLLKDQELGELARKDKWDQQIYDLQAALAKANQALTIAQATGAANVSELTTVRASNTEIIEKYNKMSKQQTTDKEAGESFLRRLGQMLGNIFKAKE